MSSVYSSLSSPVNFLDGTYLVETLPPAAGNTFRYARVTNLFDGQSDVCISDGTFWKPVRPLSTRAVVNADAAMTLVTLVNSPTQIMQGTLTATRQITLSTQYAYPGARFRIKREALGSLNPMNVINGIAGTLLNGLGVNSWADYEFNGTAWIQTASGGLL